MRSRWFQVSIKGLLVVALVIAAYLAGRVPWERAAKSSMSRAAVLNRENEQVSLYAAVWREIALEYRDDIRFSAKEWDKQSARRFGGGGSYAWSPNSEEIRPRFKRWKFNLSSDIEIATKQLDSINAQMVCAWDRPARIERWDTEKGEFSVISPNERLERWLIIAGSEEVFAMLPDSVFDDEPDFVLIAIPSDTEILLARAEHDEMRQRDVTIQDVATTTFGFVETERSFVPGLNSLRLKPEE